MIDIYSLEKILKINWLKIKFFPVQHTMGRLLSMRCMAAWIGYIN